MSKNKRIGYNGEALARHYFGYIRFGATGLDNTDLISHCGRILMEVKAGMQVNKMPALIKKALGQAVNHSEQLEGDTIPVAVFIPKGVGEKTMGTEAFAVVRLCDMRTLLDEHSDSKPVPLEVTIAMSDGEVHTIGKD